MAATLATWAETPIGALAVIEEGPDLPFLIKTILTTTGLDTKSI